MRVIIAGERRCSPKALPKGAEMRASTWARR
jgi:hypothetical protein